MWACFFLMCMTTIHAVLRKFTSFGGFTDNVDITNLTMILIVFCGLAFMESERGHVRVNVFVDKFPIGSRRVVQAIMYFITTIILFIMFYAVVKNIGPMMHSGAATTALHIPNWPFAIILSVGVFFYALTALLHAIGFCGKPPEEKKEGIGEIDVTNQL
jgi:TRAP-type C4-dicarboxylate transport system permease small subunit